VTAPEDETAPLYALPPGQFVAARDRMAGELRRQGRKAEAAAVKALMRPSPSVFAVNQLARRDPAGLERLAKATAALERTQGAGAADEDRRAYREALAEQREAMERLVDQARTTLEDAGLGTGRAVLDRIGSNLRFAMLDENARDLVRRGRLARDVEAPDLWSLLDRPSSLAGPRGTAAPARDRPARSEEAPAARPDASTTRAARRRERLEDTRTRHAEAESEVTRLRKEAALAQAAHQHAEEALEAARRQVADRQNESAEARRNEADTARSLARSEASLARLIAELSHLQHQSDDD
jgi:hypothetical protein